MTADDRRPAPTDDRSSVVGRPSSVVSRRLPTSVVFTMRIIILNQFFYPDHSATSQLMTDLAESLVERGVAVTALAGRGRYTGGEKLRPSDEYKGVRIARAWSTGFGKRSIAGRISDYLSFYFGASWKLLRLPSHDAVMALTTPPLIGLVALLIGRLRRMRVIMLVQDVYPDIAVALGALRPGSPATKALEWISRQVLRKSDRIVVLSQSMREHIAAKVGDARASRIDVIHNWADGTDIRPLTEANNPFVMKHNLEESFVVLFSGNLGRVNEFSTVLEAALLLRDRSDILFLFVGEGAKEAEIREFRRKHCLENVKLLPYEPRHLLRYSLAAGHALLVTLADGLAGLSVPSKAYAIMAAGRPLLFVGDPRSDIARIVTENRCGAVVASGDSGRLASMITEWSSDRQKLEEFGSAARSLFEVRFDRARAVSAYLETFAKCISLKAVSSSAPGSGEARIKDTIL
ncbi:MAG: glycosyltransferase family 4 protein [Acidobacteriota bacterium]